MWSIEKAVTEIDLDVGIRRQQHWSSYHKKKNALTVDKMMETLTGETELVKGNKMGIFCTRKYKTWN